MMSRTTTIGCSDQHFQGSRAFTLVEMMVSLVIMSILMVAMGGALLMSSQALPGENSRTGRIAAAAEIANQIASELTYATGVTELTASAITFNVADRDADSNPETIRYAWSGTAGDPLTRQYNGGTAVTVAEDVHDLTFTMGMKTETVQPPDEIQESAEFVLASRDILVSPANFAIKEKEWVGQYFTPVLPAEATQWKVTRVLVMARVHGAAKGIIAVQLRTAAAGNVPSATVLEEQLLNESSLGESYAWEEIPFTQVTGLAPGEGLCLVLGCNKKDSDLGDAQYDDGGGSGMLTTTSSGSTWNATTGKSLRFYVYGTLLTPVTPPPDITYWLRRINVSLQIGPDSAVRAETAARVLNEPEVTP